MNSCQQGTVPSDIGILTENNVDSWYVHKHR